ncbi:DUF732 domain-containing protein [Mycobacterium sp.]|uniref:DUF732 domain-containing protein n=1 Tax=Mycobacterium sp. TaxID=1785 RepID=UPI003C79167A
MLVAAVLVGIWLAPRAYADPQDSVLLSYLAANKVAVDSNTAIHAAHVACAQIVGGESTVVVASVVAREFPTVNGDEYWIAAGARKAYCP